MPRPKKIITKTQLAAILGLSKARISQLCKMEGFPLRPDGRVNRDHAQAWYYDRGLDEQFSKRGPRPRDSSPPEERGADRDGAVLRSALIDALHAERLETLRAIAAPAEVLRFCRVALAASCSTIQAYALATWHGIAPALATADIESEDLIDFGQVTDEQWRNLLGADFDFDAGDTLHDEVTEPETRPDRSETEKKS